MTALPSLAQPRTIELEQVGERAVPAEGLIDLMPDGRVLVLTDDHRILREIAPGGGQFDEVGRIADGIISSFGASFFTVSPDGSYLAFGDNNFGSGRVYVTLTSLLTAPGRELPLLGIDIENFAADWKSTTELAVSYGDPVTGFGEVAIITIGFPLTKAVVLEGIGGASGGVGFDSSGNLFGGNGFDFVPGVGSSTGDVRGFSAHLVQAVLDGARGPINFEDEGFAIADRLSAGGLNFDPSGNLFIGGGDLFGGSGDYNYFAVLNGDAVADIIAGRDTNPLRPADTFTDDPSALTGESLYSGWFDEPSGEWLMRSSDDPATLFRYRVKRLIADDAFISTGRTALP